MKRFCALLLLLALGFPARAQGVGADFAHDMGSQTWGDVFREGILLKWQSSRFYTGFYDRVEVSWERRLASCLAFRISARAHFMEAGFMGWQQVASLRFDISSPIFMRKR